MQQNKGNNKIYTIGSDEEKNVMDIFRTLSIMKIRRIGQFYNSIKRCGVNVSDVLMLLVLMPFYHLKSIPVLVKSGLETQSGVECGKSVFYDLKNNTKINWRSLLHLVALRFKNLSQEINIDVKYVRAFIFDDSPLPKSGIKTEMVSRIHDHVTQSFIFGYKILVMGYWDGFSFYPLDFSLHREKGNQIDKIKTSLDIANNRLSKQRQVVKKCKTLVKEVQKKLNQIVKENNNKQTKATKKKIEVAKNKVKRAKQKLKEAEAKYTELENIAIEKRTELKEVKKSNPHYGLTDKQKNEQFTKCRNPQHPASQRVEEVDMKKTKSLILMLRRAIKRGFTADYVLTDSWFYNSELVKEVSRLNKKHKINLITMAKMTTTKYKLLLNDRYYNSMELLTKLERKAINARSHKAKYIKVPVTLGDIRLNLFFVKIGVSPNWKVLVTTDLGINFQKLMDVYQIRWSIELFFRESKQFLNLGKSKSTCFDTQIADATISLIQYVILSFHRRITDYSSFDGIFASALDDALQYSIASELQKLFFIVLDVFSEFLGVDAMEMMRTVLRSVKACEKIKLLNPIFYENLEKNEAA